jgi:hypothetical protein
MRKALLAFTMTSAAAFSLMVPGTALAGDYEYDNAVLGPLPATWHCADPMPDVQVCYERGGDKWWVQDRKDDHKSAIVEWRNIHEGRVHRTGRCTNSHGAGTWAYCNKDYHEGSKLEGRQGTWDRSAGDDYFTYLKRWVFQ